MAWTKVAATGIQKVNRLERHQRVGINNRCDWWDMWGEGRRAQVSPRFLGWKTTWMLLISQLGNHSGEWESHSGEWERWSVLDINLSLRCLWYFLCLELSKMGWEWFESPANTVRTTGSPRVIKWQKGFMTEWRTVKEMRKSMASKWGGRPGAHGQNEARGTSRKIMG